MATALCCMLACAREHVCRRRCWWITLPSSARVTPITRPAARLPPALQALGRGHKVCPYYPARKWAEVRQQTGNTSTAPAIRYACWLPSQLQPQECFAPTCRCSAPLPSSMSFSEGFALRCSVLPLQEAEVIFAPYSYLLDPVIRRAMSVGALAGCGLAGCRLPGGMSGRAVL